MQLGDEFTGITLIVCVSCIAGGAIWRLFESNTDTVNISIAR